MKTKLVILLLTAGLSTAAVAGEPAAPAPSVPGTGGVEFRHWNQGDDPVKLIRKEEGFCALTSVSGEFEGSGELVHVYIADDGYWYLGGRSKQHGVSADCMIVRYVAAPASAAAQEKPLLPAAPVSEAGEVKILAASYSFGAHYADVTERVAAYVRTGEVFQANPGCLGSDPEPYWNKCLVIFYEVRGKRAMWSVGEGDDVSRDLLVSNAHLLAEKPACVTVRGAGLKAPVVLELTPGMTAMEAAEQAVNGDFGFNDPRKISLLRAGKTIVIKVKELRVNPDLDLKLQADDEIVIPTTIF